MAYRIGIDLGGTKIAGILFGPDDMLLAEARRPTPRGDYPGTLAAIAAMVAELEQSAGVTARVGIGMPGSISPVTGRVQNANSVWLNDQPLAEDLETALGRPMRLANDADCLALSEATDGAAAAAHSVFGAILGTGCGGGLVVGGRLVRGPNRCTGEWGHVPLPWPSNEEYPGPSCWCGRRGCLETWLSGSGLERDHTSRTGERLSASEIARRATEGDGPAGESLERHLSRLARGLAMIVNILDPETIVLGGGLSRMVHLYERLPGAVAPYVFAARPKVSVLAPRFGDASGVRGAARLWDRAE